VGTRADAGADAAQADRADARLGGRASFGDHCFDCARAIAVSAKGGVIEECGHWVFEEKADFIRQQLGTFRASHEETR
jgi:pimeloyl-ACP methyl ester carboxylesterase